MHLASFVPSPLLTQHSIMASSMIVLSTENFDNISAEEWSRLQEGLKGVGFDTLDWESLLPQPVETAPSSHEDISYPIVTNMDNSWLVTGDNRWLETATFEEVHKVIDNNNIVFAQHETARAMIAFAEQANAAATLVSLK